jgi:glutamate decarboxylase
MTEQKKHARAGLDYLDKIFTIPEAPDSTLGKIEQDISVNLTGFLQNNIVAIEKDLGELESDFSDAQIPEEPMFVSEQTEFLMSKLVAQSVHTASPSFVGHMTSALPYFMLPLSKIMMALNQNLVKIETSKAFTPMERQVLGMIHGLVYRMDSAFYKEYMHSSEHSLGAFCSGGTLANLTALWVARNSKFPPQGDFPGIENAGVFAALKHYEHEGAAILVSKRGHYSLSKAASVLGFGRDAIVAISTTDKGRLDLEVLEQECQRLQQAKIKIISIVGVAGSSETGSVDPLDEMADIAERYGAHFHVDAAWGGPTLFSSKYSHLLKGIERADSVTIDAHKQLYVPMGAGMVVFKDPASVAKIEHHAEYIIRKGSKDLGSHTLEGSRSGMAMLVHSGLKIIGRKGYELLIEQGIEKAKAFSEMIAANPSFELVTEPQLNILTYRYVPEFAREALEQALERGDKTTASLINSELNALTKFLQKAQRASGKSFVSRTKINVSKYGEDPVAVFRVVLANPLTDMEILEDILNEQIQIAESSEATPYIEKAQQVLNELHKTFSVSAKAN